jgi:hypothetical protein
MHDEEETTWRDDLVVEVVHDFVARALCQISLEELDLPHVVICHDDESGLLTYAGPFGTAMEALVAAEAESTESAGTQLRYSVAPLYPAAR